MSERAAISDAPPIAGASSDAATAGIVGLAAAGALLRVAILFRYRIDSDETQHLHVVWGWTHGLVPYRDFFDNHMPLFHILMTPLLRLTGERPEALLYGRLVMLPMFAAIALLAYRIGRSCYPPRAAVLAMMAGCLAPNLFVCSAEFRTDVLWALFWMASVAMLVGGTVTLRRAALAGLFLGLAAAVSAKTVMMAVALGVAAVVTAIVARGRPARKPRPVSGRGTVDRESPPGETLGGWRAGRPRSMTAAVFTAAALLPPALVAAYFASIGAWKSFVYCTVSHNIVVSDHPKRMLLLPIVVAIIVVVTRHILRQDVPAEVRRLRVFLFLTASIYAGTLITLWPVIETEHWLPFYPLAGAAMAPLLRPRLTVALLAFELFWIVRATTPWQDQVTPAIATIQQATRLTSPAERVLDLKGEIVFRRRSFYYVLEKMTKKKLSRGDLQDTIVADMLRTGTMVAVRDNVAFPPATRAFLQRNFVSIGCVRVPGVVVANGAFRIEVPAEYAVVSQHGRFQGTLDGTPYAGPRRLRAGVHTISTAAQSDMDAVVWQRAAALGYSPFAPDRRCANLTGDLSN